MRIETLYREQAKEIGLLTPELQYLYDGNLTIPKRCDSRPYVIGNFVETLDGVVSYLIPGRASGQTISEGSGEDHFVMGLLRAISDAVLIGSGTLRAGHGHACVPEQIYPASAPLYAMLRKKLGLSTLPINVILTESGNVNLNKPTFHTEELRVVIITGDEGTS